MPPVCVESIERPSEDVAKCPVSCMTSTVVTSTKVVRNGNTQWVDVRLH